MSQFYITSENTEDTFDCTDSREDAFRIAREMAQNGQAGDLVCVEYEGKNIGKFCAYARWASGRRGPCSTY